MIRMNSSAKFLASCALYFAGLFLFSTCISRSSYEASASYYTVLYGGSALFSPIVIFLIAMICMSGLRFLPSSRFYKAGWWNLLNQTFLAGALINIGLQVLIMAVGKIMIPGYNSATDSTGCEELPWSVLVGLAELIGRLFNT